MSSSYQPLPTSSRPSSPSHNQTFPPQPSSPTLDDNDDDDYNRRPRDPSYRPLRSAVRAEFNRPPPPWWKRLLLIVALIGMGWISVHLGKIGLGLGGKKPDVIYASRYSEEFKYRPAASPVITETLSDGRIRIRGASIGAHGVREEDIPLTPAQIALREKQRREEAREKAREKMGLKKGKKGKKSTAKELK
ncbi:hypothetical protein CI109_104008 [Kwoniella shandongensis]|uniref:Uncharacterized protein n=1 Tax=Kwoniella shandongensis TaxID=1734106 RepID=A0A5M6BXH8_9TREE|nr:uncharacterized protein CI109_004107 [Kwoniella shandongensis]KAA5527568.1 hypothetical protein CI109_004107 [Kwoniella shandongensis]